MGGGGGGGSFGSCKDFIWFDSSNISSKLVQVAWQVVIAIISSSNIFCSFSKKSCRILTNFRFSLIFLSRVSVLKRQEGLFLVLRQLDFADSSDKIFVSFSIILNSFFKNSTTLLWLDSFFKNSITLI